MAETTDYFKISEGYVHITEDALKIWRETSLANFQASIGMGRITLIIGGFLVAFGAIAYKYMNEDIQSNQDFIFYTTLSGAVLAGFLIFAIYELSFNYATEIPRSAIVKMEYKKRIPLLFASRIMVHYEKGNKLRKRPLSFSRFQQGADKKAALQQLKDADLYHPGDDDEDVLDS